MNIVSVIVITAMAGFVGFIIGGIAAFNSASGSFTATLREVYNDAAYYATKNGDKAVKSAIHRIAVSADANWNEISGDDVA